MTLKVHRSIFDFKAEAWNSLVPLNFPFAKHEFLAALEKSNSTGKRTGWHPQFIGAYQEDTLIGAFILYLKTNSYGEYIFDWSWANAWQRYGFDYYPKLTSAIPFTPATGSKILTTTSQDKDEISRALIKKALELKKELSASTIHLLFTQASENALINDMGLTLRKTFQFHWFNDSYQDFDSFLTQLKQKKRQKIRRERKGIQQNKNISIKEISGNDVKDYHQCFYQLYLSTIDKKSSFDYLTQEFFTEIFHSMPDNILLYLAYEGDEVIAGTLNFIGGDKLYGRYWGAFKDIQHLHFELCYYLPIEYAIRNNIHTFEAGAQGEHKIQRGFIPSYTYSHHELSDNLLTTPIIESINSENIEVDDLISKARSFVYKETH
jgi:uncharacterized protein